MSSNYFLVKNEYHKSSDNLNIHILGKYECYQSIEIDENLLIDFNQENVPVSIQLNNASQLLEVNKQSLKKISTIRIEIITTPEFINLYVNLVLKVKKEDVEKTLESSAANMYEIPANENSFTSLGVY